MMDKQMLSEDTIVGSGIKMGKYGKAGKNKDFEPIVWKILDVRDDKALLWSEKLLAYKPYHETEGEISWQNSSLRTWLNSIFIETAFSKEEAERLCPNPDGDLAFLLGREEIEAYTEDKVEFNRSNMEEIPSRTAMVIGKKKISGDEYWWVRDIMDYSDRFGSSACHIDHHGFYGSTPTYCERWVRPACMIRRSALDHVPEDCR